MRASVRLVLAAAVSLASPRLLGDAEPAAGPVPPTAAETLLLPGAANTLGTHGSRWRSDLSLKNPGGEPVEARVFFLRTGGPNDLASAPHRDYFLLAGESKEIRNVLGGDFALAGTGALLVVASQQVFPNNPAGSVIAAWLRTAATVRLLAGEPGTLIAPAEPSDAPRQMVAAVRHDGLQDKGRRGAIGALNLSRSQVMSVKVEYLDDAGELLGTQFLRIEPLSVSQQTIAPRLRGAVARFTRTDGNGGWVAYATVVDNVTEESTFLYAAPETGQPAAPHRLSYAALAEKADGN